MKEGGDFMEQKRYMIALTKDYIDGFVAGAVATIVVGLYLKHRKSKKEEA